MKLRSEYKNINTHSAANVLTFFATPDQIDKDYYSSRKGKLNYREISFYMDPEWSLKEMHPDLYGLACLLVFGPFTGENITLDKAVSSTFAEVVFKNLHKTIGPVDSGVSPRQVPQGSRDGVAFSGGVDSCAALFLMPKNSVPIFLKRSGPNVSEDQVYRADAALHTCHAVSKAGYDTRILGTNLELVRDPIGFPVDWANSAPSVLHADQLKLRSIAFGTVAESAFFLGHNHFSDPKSRVIYKAWAPLFDAVGLPICLPVAGLSEVATSRLAIECLPEWFPQSCVRGQVGQPCMMCFKCFRKTLLEARITGKEVPLKHFDIAKKSREVARRLLAQPIHHEDGLAYSVHGKYDYNHDVYQALKLKTSAMHSYGKGLSFLERFYPAGYQYVPNFVRDEFRAKLRQHVDEMSPEDINIVENWNLDSLVHDERYREGQAKLSAILDRAPTFKERLHSRLSRALAHLRP